MSEAALALAASVAMHVTWNLLVRRQPQASYPLWWVLLGHLVLLAPAGWFCLWRDAAWQPALLGAMLLSASGNVIYFIGLRKAYEYAPVALVYPLVRSSPLLIALWSTMLLGETLRPAAWAGIVVTVLGLLLLALAGTGPGVQRRALPWALLAMLGTSLYSLSDKAATAYLDSFWAVVGYLSVGYAASWLALTLQLRHEQGAWVPPRRIRWSLFVIGGVCVGLSYALVIHAMRFLPAAEVVAYTNAGIAVASVLSMAMFREREQWRWRLAAAGVITLGLFLLAG
ncbi:MAG: EamA family transporter [Tepidiphilus sp.]|jgi:phosphonate utilization associated putative membrane protein|nr:EamA family transporter [Tepidiphilus sp.]MDD3433426.1 EamA family transporter [Tepidiphilus sp.]